MPAFNLMHKLPGGLPTELYGAPVDRETKKDLDIAILSIVFGIVFFVITGFPAASPLFTAYLKDELGISNKAFGLIMTLPYLTVLIQIPFSNYVARHGRIKKSFLIAGYLTRLMFFIPAILPLVAPEIPSTAAMVVIGIVMLLSSLFNWVADSALTTWFGSMIPSQIKGQYLSTRQMLFSLASLIYALILAFSLRAMPDNPWKYTIFFTTAVVFGLIDITFYIRARPPEKAYLPWQPAPAADSRQSIRQFIEPLHDRAYRNYLLFVISWSFAIYLVAPYFNVYLLNNLKLSLNSQTWLQQIIPAIATVLFLRKIGRLYDQKGIRPTLLASCGIIIILPFAWLLATPDSWWFLLISNSLSGIFGVGVDMAILSLGIFLAPHNKRSPYLAMKNVLVSGIGIIPAVLLGGFLADWLEPLLQKAAIPFWRGQLLQPFHVMLILSVGLRLLSFFLFATRVNERKSQSVRS